MNSTSSEIIHWGETLVLMKNASDSPWNTIQKPLTPVETSRGGTDFASSHLHTITNTIKVFSCVVASFKVESDKILVIKLNIHGIREERNKNPTH